MGVVVGHDWHSAIGAGGGYRILGVRLATRFRKVSCKEKPCIIFANFSSQIRLVRPFLPSKMIMRWWNHFSWLWGSCQRLTLSALKCFFSRTVLHSRSDMYNEEQATPAMKVSLILNVGTAFWCAWYWVRNPMVRENLANMFSFFCFP